MAERQSYTCHGSRCLNSCPKARGEMLNSPMFTRAVHDAPSIGTETAYSDYYDGAWWATFTLATGLLLTCALLAGLTLAICGLDRNILQVKSITGNAKQKQQAVVVARMKQQGTWMLCSLIICSVALGEAFPFVIQDLAHERQPWIPILVSTLLLAVFAEILPQFIIPRQAVRWGYYCSPFIWGCMWLTAAISYPLAWMLDILAGREHNYGSFTNNELGPIIRYHESAERRGGQLSQDASRIMQGALSVDSRKVGGDICSIPEPSYQQTETDIEKADILVTHGMIVKWTSVRHVNYDDVVDDAFIEKIKSWSYSRIPVIGQATHNSGPFDNLTSWDGNKIFGFLHVKNLIGVRIPTEYGTLLVKDLPLYPLPIVREDMPVYELLNTFQLGISRMAVVIPAAVGLLGVFADDFTAIESSPFKSPLWSATEKTQARIRTRMKASKGFRSSFIWTRDSQDTEDIASGHDICQKIVCGIRVPKPIGIITFEDIVDSILQKTSFDEKDFYDQDNKIPLTKSKKVGDYYPKPAVRTSRRIAECPEQENKCFLTGSKRKITGTLRNRKLSKVETVHLALDGADDRSFQGPDISVRHYKVRQGNKNSHSSYTDNSLGGFHANSGSTSPVTNALIMTCQEIAQLGITSSSECPGNPYSLAKATKSTTFSFPVRKTRVPLSNGGLENFRRSFTTIPFLSRTPPVPTFFERETTPPSNDTQNLTEHQLVMPIPSTVDKDSRFASRRIGFNDSGLDTGEFKGDLSGYSSEDSVRRGETISLGSWNADNAERPETCYIYDADPVSTLVNSVGNSSISVCIPEGHFISQDENKKPYDGFPLELLETSRKAYQAPETASMTMPRLYTLRSCNTYANEYNCETPCQERSVYNDRALLPSQRRALDLNATNDGMRSSSLWF